MKKYILSCLMVLFSLPAFASLNAPEAANNIAENGEQILENAQMTVVENLSDIDAKITGKAQSMIDDQAKQLEDRAISAAKDATINKVNGALGIDIGLSESILDPKETVGFTESALVGELGKSLSEGGPSVSDIKTRVSKTTISDSTTPGTLAATTDNAESQLFVASAKGFAIGLVSQMKSLEGVEEANEVREDAEDADTFIEMNRLGAVSVVQMTQKLSTLSMLYNQMLEMDSAAALVGKTTGGKSNE